MLETPAGWSGWLLAKHLFVILNGRLDHLLGMICIVDPLNVNIVGFNAGNEFIGREIVSDPLHEDIREIINRLDITVVLIIVENGDDLVIRLTLVNHVEPPDDPRTRSEERRVGEGSRSGRRRGSGGEEHRAK